MFFSKFKLYSFADWVIPVVFILSLVECYLQNWSFSVLVKLVSIILSVLIVCKDWGKCTHKIFNILFFLILFSLVSYLYNGRPLVCAQSDMMNMVPSMLLFYIGMNDQRNSRDYYDNIMYIGTIILALGLLCYILTPSWYIDSLLNARNNNPLSSYQMTEDHMLSNLRFVGFFIDSYPMSLFSIYILSFSLFNYFREDRIIKYSGLCFIISLIAVILNMHRASIAAAVLICVFFLGYKCVKGKGKQVFRIICSILILVILVTFISEDIRERLFSLLDMLKGRTEDMSFSGAYSERQGLSKKLMSQWSFPLFGHGIGSGGPTSRFMGYGGVTDAAYTKLIFENGVIGFGLFVVLILGTCMRGLKYFKYYIAELSIIGFVCLAMTGSNTLTLAYNYILPFWYVLGKIWNRTYIKYAIENRIHI